MNPERYHFALRVLHWLTGVMIVMSLAMGTFALAATPNASPDKVFALRMHMIAGGAILLLMLVRMALRLGTRHPPPATSGIAAADKAAPVVHWLLYVLVFVMIGSGSVMAVATGLPAIVFGGVGTLPADFGHLWAKRVHATTALLLAATIVLHIAAALYHQFVRRDRLLSRMGFRGGSLGPSSPRRVLFWTVLPALFTMTLAATAQERFDGERAGVKTVLLVGRLNPVVEDARGKAAARAVTLLAATNLEQVKAAFATHKIDAVIIGAGVDLDQRLAIVRHVFEASASTTVHLKDSNSGPQGFLPFVDAVLRVLAHRD